MFDFSAPVCLSSVFLQVNLALFKSCREHPKKPRQPISWHQSENPTENTVSALPHLLLLQPRAKAKSSQKTKEIRSDPHTKFIFTHKKWRWRWSGSDFFFFTTAGISRTSRWGVTHVSFFFLFFPSLLYSHVNSYEQFYGKVKGREERFQKMSTTKFVEKCVNFVMQGNVAKLSK